ncbi:MAG: PIN domain-containing protein [Acidimicrobiia bacterium]|nr:PIN domain-containing protein [Acidimicrobiia bacterium]
MIADTSGLLALFNDREPRHADVTAVVSREAGPLVVSPFVLAEIDYIVATRLGVEAELSVLRELSGGAYELAACDRDEVETCVDLITRYRDQEIGIADASMVVLARRYNTRRLLTLDVRHFDVLRPLNGGRFHIVPAP